MLIVGVLLVVIGIILHFIIKLNLTPEERQELEYRKQRRKQIQYDLNRPLVEREKAHTAGLLVKILSPQGLLICIGIILILYAIRR